MPFCRAWKGYESEKDESVPAPQFPQSKQLNKLIMDISLSANQQKKRIYVPASLLPITKRDKTN
jgi:hypothetical protein